MSIDSHALAKEYLGKIIYIVIDRPINTRHPKHPDIIYRLNYGYIPNTVSGDGEELDAYLIGVNEPVNEFTGKCIAIIHRLNDNDDKIIVAHKDHKSIGNEKIDRLVNFQEKFFKHEIIR